MKKPWLSKTIWANFIIAGLAFVPAIAEKVSPEQIVLGLTLVNVILRLVTKEKLSLE